MLQVVTSIVRLFIVLCDKLLVLFICDFRFDLGDALLLIFICLLLHIFSMVNKNSPISHHLIARCIFYPSPSNTIPTFRPRIVVHSSSAFDSSDVGHGLFLLWLAELGKFPKITWSAKFAGFSIFKYNNISIYWIKIKAYIRKGASNLIQVQRRKWEKKYGSLKAFFDSAGTRICLCQLSPHLTMLFIVYPWSKVDCIPQWWESIWAHHCRRWLWLNSCGVP